MKSRIKLFQKNDLLVLIIISAICIILLLPKFYKSDASVAVISVNGEEVQSINLNKTDEAYKIKLDCSPSLTVEVANGKIRILNAECHDKLCVKCGWLDSSGDMAVCLPARVCVSIKSSSSSPDIMTY